VKGQLLRAAVAACGLALVGGMVAGAPAAARPIEKGHFHDIFTSDVYDCDGTPAQDSGDVSGNFVFNQRGSSPFPYGRESVHGTVVTTNLLKDPGEVRFAFDIDYNGTPGDPSDDVEVPDSFRVVRSSTGNSDFSDRDFCADLVEFTS
jgi:hypothetical protein